MSGLDRAERLLWICLLLLVPVSASPLLPFGSGTLVRPLSFVPAVLLLGTAAFRILFLRQRPQLGADGSWLLGLFTAYIVIAGLIQISGLPDEPFKGQTPLDSFVRALATLFVGAAFYLVARLHIRTSDDICLTIRYLFIGLSASITLAVVQVVAMVAQGQMLRTVQAITDVFAVHYDGLASRAQGMTFEPSWLATQIILLMLPALVARLISRQSFSGAPMDRRNIFAVLAGFAVALVGLLCAGSRFGIVGAIALLLVSGLMALWRGRLVAVFAFVAILLAGAGGIAALGNFSAGAGATYVLGPVGFLVDVPQIADTNNRDTATAVTDTLALAGRVAAGEAAFDLWRDRPLFGVSFGNDYRYFGRYAPDWALSTQLFTSGAQEGVGWLDPNSPEKGNAKILFLRLLSETGLVGFALFAIFFVRQIFAAPAHDSYYAFFRLTAFAALLFAGINQDSFADPSLWIMLVLCSAMGRLQAPRHEACATFGGCAAATS